MTTLVVGMSHSSQANFRVRLPEFFPTDLFNIVLLQ